MALTSTNSHLKTNGVLITADGKHINLGQLDRKLFGRIPWTPRLWFYKHITYRRRLHKQAKEK